MSITVNDKNLGHATAYGYAVSKGFSGTEEEFAELMADYADVGQRAETSAQTATSKASEASESALASAQSASDASVSATTAQTKANEASVSAQTATENANQASAYANTAIAKASEASTSASESAQSASDASLSASTASTKASEASESATTAETKASEASASANTASAKALEASGSANVATTKATEASQSASASETAKVGAETAMNVAVTAKNQAQESASIASQKADSITELTATATTLEPGASATANYNNGVLSIGIPRGEDGNDGHSPIITATKSGTTTTISVDGTPVATINDGQNGNDGHSPVVTATKSGTITTVNVDGTAIATINDGDDYILTAQDKQDIANLVDISSKADAITVLIGDNISGSAYKINRTYAEIAIALSEGGNVVLFDNQAIYPYVGMINLDGTAVIAFGISTTYNGTAILDGYLILQSNTAFKVSQSIKIPVNLSDLTDDVGYVKNITASKSGKVTTIYSDGTAIATINDGADGNDYTLTAQDKSDIANLVIQILPTAQGVSF